jgi:hypothetical protein
VRQEDGRREPRCFTKMWDARTCSSSESWGAGVGEGGKWGPNE